MRFSIFSSLAVALPLAAASPFNATESASELVARTTPDQDRTLSLNLHNKFRAAAGVPNLVWDSGLQASAQAYADKLAKTPGGVLVHSGAGENLWWSSAKTDHDLERATQGWTNEKSNYHGEKIPDGNFNSYGHYTQVVWKNTKKVGVAAAGDSKGGIYVVAHYDPVGNYVGQKPY